MIIYITEFSKYIKMHLICILNIFYVSQIQKMEEAIYLGAVVAHIRILRGRNDLVKFLIYEILKIKIQN